VGVCYENGDGVENDAAAAVRWYRMAAVAGNAQAQYNLGVCFDNGRGVEKDAVAAVHWYRKAAEAGDVQAQYNLGVCYNNGDGVEKDAAAAVSWYQMAADVEYDAAQLALADCFSNGTGVEKDAAAAAFWYRKAAASGNAAAIDRLAVASLSDSDSPTDVVTSSGNADTTLLEDCTPSAAACAAAVCPAADASVCSSCRGACSCLPVLRHSPMPVDDALCTSSDTKRGLVADCGSDCSSLKAASGFEGVTGPEHVASFDRLPAVGLSCCGSSGLVQSYSPRTTASVTVTVTLGSGCAASACDATGTLECGGCRSVRYCSPACQRAHWKAHKKACVACAPVAGPEAAAV
jgi:alpha/beta superfamily hydrolase